MPLAPISYRSSTVHKAIGRTLYGFAAFPVGLAGLVGSVWAGGLLVRLSHKLLGDPASPPGAPPSRGRVMVYSLASLPLNLVSFALIAAAWSIFVTRGFLYPVFAGNDLEHSWGGPTLAGAWLVHWLIGPPMVAAVAAILVPITRAQARLARGLAHQGDRAGSLVAGGVATHRADSRRRR